ncbi:hypothetical protein VP01_2908g2 [Puccinia sorghi]|uniref:Uncharacterized protein n=1 Tax=Puccinia sorghi TaxID=27349 RepID=A0A0L6V1E9_9BASI|nr:hypothetical protein VP01_2908g2 [Puccinia sorghi]
MTANITSPHKTTTSNATKLSPKASFKGPNTKVTKKSEEKFSNQSIIGKDQEVENILDLNNIPLANITPTNQAAKHPCKGTKQPAMIMDAEDSDLEVEGTFSAPPAKCT